MIFFRIVRETFGLNYKGKMRWSVAVLAAAGILFFSPAAGEAGRDDKNEDGDWPVFVSSQMNSPSQSGGGGGIGNDGQYALGPGDVLDIRVFGEPEVSTVVTVRIDGNISLPLAGELKAAGTTPENLGNQIKQRLTRFIDTPEVVVILTESRSKSYYILGQIREPGEYPIARPVTVLQAIARAGGFDEWAKKDRIMIVTEPGDQGTIEIFNYDNFLRNADSKKNIVIKPGDTIVVP